MSRQIVLDTETTGLDPRLGHRIIEVAGVELLNRRLTGRYFHRYVNPERDIDAGAEAVHGLNSAFLQDKPKFADIVEELLVFLDDDELVIHNAAFDVGFLNHELSLLDLPPVTDGRTVLDTLKLARELNPGQKNNLDALCRRYEIDNTGRTLHGALLDAELLAVVYLAMTRGQDALIETHALSSAQQESELPAGMVLPVIYANEDEQQAHAFTLQAIGKESRGNCLWLRHAEV